MVTAIFLAQAQKVDVPYDQPGPQCSDCFADGICLQPSQHQTFLNNYRQCSCGTRLHKQVDRESVFYAFTCLPFQSLFLLKAHLYCNTCVHVHTYIHVLMHILITFSKAGKMRKWHRSQLICILNAVILQGFDLFALKDSLIQEK